MPWQDDPTLATTLERALGDAAPHYGVVVKDLADGRGAALDPHRVFYAASLFKLSVLYELFYQRERGLVRFDEELLFTADHAAYALAPPSWPLTSTVPVSQLAEEMITLSDNAAAVMLYERLGMAHINAHMAALGLRQTRVDYDLPTTAADLALLLEGMATGQTVSPEASQEMLTLLLGQRVNDRIPAGLPPGTPVAHKTGNWENACHDAGIVYAPGRTYLLAVLSDEPGCSPTVAALSRAVYAVLTAGLAPGASDGLHGR